MSPRIQLWGPALFRQVREQAEHSPRKRMNYNFHSGPDDNPHRFLNVLLKGTYVQPHRHIHPPKPETFIVLEGLVAVIVFDEAGQVRESHRLGQGEASMGMDLGAGLWHTILALSDEAVCFEVKPGPWVPSTDKDFAPWAPPEGDAAAGEYLAGLARGAEAG